MSVMFILFSSALLHMLQATYVYLRSLHLLRCICESHTFAKIICGA